MKSGDRKISIIKMTEIRSLITGKKLEWLQGGSVIGQGTYGKVISYQTPEGPVAVKTSTDLELGVDSSLLREAAMLRNLHHPNILPVLDVFIIPTEMGLVFPLARQDLFAEYKQEPLTLVEVKFIVLQLMRAVAYLHSQDILHGDIKPQNILLQFPVPDQIVKRKEFRRFPELQIMLGDFGIASSSCCYQKDENEVFFTLWYRARERDIARRAEVATTLRGLLQERHQEAVDDGLVDFTFVVVQRIHSYVHHSVGKATSSCVVLRGSSIDDVIFDAKHPYCCAKVDIQMISSQKPEFFQFCRQFHQLSANCHPHINFEPQGDDVTMIASDHEFRPIGGKIQFTFVLADMLQAWAHVIVGADLECQACLKELKQGLPFGRLPGHRGKLV